jgi:hypothetical protein
VRPVLCNVRVFIGHIGDCEKGDGIDSFEVYAENDDMECPKLRQRLIKKTGSASLSASLNLGIPCPHRVYAVVFPGAVIRRRYLR